ncbi:capsular polysaccharide biosynthesis protein [Paenibacillus physcomitrellae]|uniref:Capsular polysaccharide biosynthesis protein n=1 Tax=Paenibacillus physcomitrellae TaxID=1619311 RepID=A0ABQ1GJD8_9BACL|nr:capsular polysaccharide biosynthesis protein [Paenibacillus physcomitrellae]
MVLHFGGDTLFSGKAETKLENAGYDYPFQYVNSLFTQDDLTVLNLETPVTYGGKGASDKQYVFKSSPKALEAMAEAGVDAVNLANNHTLDQGEEGLLDTLDHLKNAGIASVGAGVNADQAYAPQYFERKGIKIALFGFSRVLPKADWAAGASKPGIAGVYDPTRAYAAIKAARQKADLILVITHWGKERVQQFDDTQTALAHGLIDAGADLVIGGHPHVLQGLEQYKGKWIAYSTGNFIFTRSTNEKTWETAVFEARCSKSGSCGMKLIPYTAELAQPVPMQAEDAAKLLQEIQSLSPGVTVDKAGNVSAG